MHGAHNTAYELIETELNVCIDSDDYMPKMQLKKSYRCGKNMEDDKVSGIIGLDAYTDGKIIGTELPRLLKYITLI